MTAREKRPGRPPDAGAPRTALVKFRVTEEERASYEAAAEHEGVGLSEWVRDACERAAKT